MKNRMFPTLAANRLWSTKAKDFSGGSYLVIAIAEDNYLMGSFLD